LTSNSFARSCGVSGQGRPARASAAAQASGSRSSSASAAEVRTVAAIRAVVRGAAAQDHLDRLACDQAPPLLGVSFSMSSW